MGYRCNEEKGWVVGFQACVCPDENILSQMIDEVLTSKLENSKEFSKDPFCCSSTLLTTTTGKNHVNKGQDISEGNCSVLNSPEMRTKKNPLF